MEKRDPKLNQIAKGEGPTDGYLKFSLSEIGIWVTVFAIAWSSPNWIGESSVLVNFYGIIAVMTWRLRQFMPFGLALVLASLLGLASTYMANFILNR